jgi:hypothetical protein
MCAEKHLSSGSRGQECVGVQVGAEVNPATGAGLRLCAPTPHRVKKNRLIFLKIVQI